MYDRKLTNSRESNELHLDLARGLNFETFFCNRVEKIVVTFIFTEFSIYKTPPRFFLLFIWPCNEMARRPDEFNATFVTFFLFQRWSFWHVSKWKIGSKKYIKVRRSENKRRALGDYFNYAERCLMRWETWLRRFLAASLRISSDSEFRLFPKGLQGRCTQIFL